MEADPAYVKQNLLSAEPTPNHAVGADLGGKVIYLGADLDRETVKPGEKLTVIHYWKVVQPPGTEWRIFTHVDGATGKDWLNVDSTKMRSSYGPDKWKAGDLIRDEQTITMKSDWSSSFAAIHVGLYKKGSSSDKDRLPVVSGPTADKGRILVARLAVGASGVAKPTGGYVIQRAKDPIVIDGKADEPAWAKAQTTASWKDAEGGGAVGGVTVGRLLWDDKNLYAFIDVTDADVFSSYTKNDDTIWMVDVVELFIYANGDGRGYVELQVNPNNAQFDSWFAGTRQGGGDVGFASGMTSAVTVDGTKDNRSDTDRGWHVEIAIPLNAVKGKDAAMAVTLPPRPGDGWKLNLVRVEKGKGAAPMTASSWAQITIADFHAIDRLLPVTFGDQAGAAFTVRPIGLIPSMLKPGAPPIRIVPAAKLAYPGQAPETTAK